MEAADLQAIETLITDLILKHNEQQVWIRVYADAISNGRSANEAKSIAIDATSHFTNVFK